MILSRINITQGVRANKVSAGTTYFEAGILNQIKDGDPELYQMALDINPTGRTGTPQEMAIRRICAASRRSAFTTIA